MAILPKNQMTEEDIKLNFITVQAVETDKRNVSEKELDRLKSTLDIGP